LECQRIIYQILARDTYKQIHELVGFPGYFNIRYINEMLVFYRCSHIRIRVV